MTSFGPPSTVSRGPLIQAISSSPGRIWRIEFTDETMASNEWVPAVQYFPRSSALRPTTNMVSVTDRTPARFDAAYSPRLCPRTALGIMPHAVHKRASAIWIQVCPSCSTIGENKLSSVIVPFRRYRDDGKPWHGQILSKSMMSERNCLEPSNSCFPKRWIMCTLTGEHEYCFGGLRGYGFDCLGSS